MIFRCWDDNQSFLIFASLSDNLYSEGYLGHNSRIEQGIWTEIFNSDAKIYGVDNIGNLGGNINCQNGVFHAVIPFSGVLVFKHD